MPIFQLSLLTRQLVATNTVECHFEKPAHFAFQPGQYGGFTLQHTTRRFSLLSTPDDPYLAIATRIQSSLFKTALMNLPIGEKIKFAGPSGNFILHDIISIPAVFIAGGIRIAPFYSMIRYALNQKIIRPLILFYGNEVIESAPYLQALTYLAKKHPHFIFVPTLSAYDEAWHGETGFITGSMIQKYIPHLHTPIYYVCGSGKMVLALQKILRELKVPDNQIKCEDFPGY